MQSRNYVNVVVAGKSPELQWLDMDAAIKHCTAGLGIWEWASNDGDGAPGRGHGHAPGTSRRWRPWRPWRCCATHCPELKVRVVNVVGT